MTQQQKTVTIFGGTGFVGRNLVWALARAGYAVKVATRVPERAFFLKPAGDIGQVVPVLCDYKDPKSIKAVIEGSSAVINCIGILFEKKKKQNFEAVHTDLPAAIAKTCAKAGVDRLVHISALGVDTCASDYAASKLAGEKAVLKNFKGATILRPSIIFGEDDNFFNMFAKLAGILPALPLIGGGETKFQPVFVGDVVDAIMAAITRPALGKGNPQGKIYALGGPEVQNFRALYETMFSYTGKRVMLVPLPWCVAKMEAFFMEKTMSAPLLTRDQVKALRSDNVVADDALTLDDLGIEATPMKMILPGYLSRYRKGGRFADIENA